VGTRSQAASKENPTTTKKVPTTTKELKVPTITKKVPATRPEAAGKAVKISQPLQESQARISLHGAKDAQKLALALERIALQQGSSSVFIFD
jgi:hypothetical protein